MFSSSFMVLSFLSPILNGPEPETASQVLIELMGINELTNTLGLLGSLLGSWLNWPIRP